ncbi:adrenocortical dysplasia protein homolog isoform X2 [Clupea harengus]|uniref:Adrenocortical dysplasia protein homolog isoform X2 n=1 Tax=Clupea harengus TaxID=7950 RepID=A0A6P8ES57_CLUHA|nr:adrenocortical dysplasia protein homolog isoform X2 [Clupea harengus]
MPRLGRNRTDPEPWIEQLVRSFGTTVPQDRAVKATVIGARDLTESQDEADASCVIFLSDGVVFIPAVLTTHAWTRLQDMEERESFSGLENAIVCVKNLQLNFHMEPELVSCQFYVTVNQISTVGQGSAHRGVPNCATLPSIKEQIHKTWRSRLDESSSESQYGFRLTDLLEEWEKYVNTEIPPQEMIDRPTPLSEATPSHRNMNTPPGPSTSHQDVDTPKEPSTSYHTITPPISGPHAQSLEGGVESVDGGVESVEGGVESVETQVLRRIMSRLAPPTRAASYDDLTTPTQWDQDRLAYKAEECFSIPVCQLLIPEDQREKMIATVTAAASISSSTPSGLVPPLSDRQTGQPIATQNDVQNQSPSPGERTDDWPRSSGVSVAVESVSEGSPWDIFAPVVDILRSSSSSETSATPDDLPLLQSQSASATPDDLPLLQSQSASVLPENLPFLQSQSDSTTAWNLPLIECQSDSDNPLLTKIQSDSATPEKLSLTHSQWPSATLNKLSLLQGLTSLRTPENPRHLDCCQSGSTSTEKFPLHQSLLVRLGSAPIGTSTQYVSSNGSSGAKKTGSALPPYQLACISSSHSSGKRATPCPSPEDEEEEEEEDEDGKAARSPPSWIALTQRTGSNHGDRGSEPKRRMFASPSKQIWVSSPGWFCVLLQI